MTTDLWAAIDRVDLLMLPHCQAYVVLRQDAIKVALKFHKKASKKE